MQASLYQDGNALTEERLPTEQLTVHHSNQDHFLQHGKPIQKGSACYVSLYINKHGD